jgi:hypothetical protein
VHGSSPYEVFADRLARYLGPNTARVALKTFFARLAPNGRGVETLTRDDAPPLLEALRPMLRTLLGSERAERVLVELVEDLR